MRVRSVSTRAVVFYDEMGTKYTVPAYGDLEVPDMLWSDTTFRKWVRWKFREIDISSANHVMEDPEMSADNVIQPIGMDMDTIVNLKLKRASATATANMLEVRTEADALLGGITSAGMLKFVAANQQTTVGAAGGASALPATPTRYFKVKDDAGTTLVIPAYAAS